MANRSTPLTYLIRKHNSKLRLQMLATLALVIGACIGEAVSAALLRDALSNLGASMPVGPVLCCCCCRQVHELVLRNMWRSQPLGTLAAR
jgi:hypothetical protein